MPNLEDADLFSVNIRDLVMSGWVSSSSSSSLLPREVKEVETKHRKQEAEEITEPTKQRVSGRNDIPAYLHQISIDTKDNKHPLCARQSRANILAKYENAVDVFSIDNPNLKLDHIIPEDRLFRGVEVEMTNNKDGKKTKMFADAMEGCVNLQPWPPTHHKAEPLYFSWTRESAEKVCRTLQPCHASLMNECLGSENRFYIALYIILYCYGGCYLHASVTNIPDHLVSKLRHVPATAGIRIIHDDCGRILSVSSVPKHAFWQHCLDHMTLTKRRWGSQPIPPYAVKGEIADSVFGLPLLKEVLEAHPELGSHVLFEAPQAVFNDEDNDKDEKKNKICLAPDWPRFMKVYEGFNFGSRSYSSYSPPWKSSYVGNFTAWSHHFRQRCKSKRGRSRKPSPSPEPEEWRYDRTTGWGVKKKDGEASTTYTPSFPSTSNYWYPTPGKSVTLSSESSLPLPSLPSSASASASASASSSSSSFPLPSTSLLNDIKRDILYDFLYHKEMSDQMDELRAAIAEAQSRNSDSMKRKKMTDEGDEDGWMSDNEMWLDCEGGDDEGDPDPDMTPPKDDEGDPDPDMTPPRRVKNRGRHTGWVTAESYDDVVNMDD